jgi:hypothetical protein
VGANSGGPLGSVRLVGTPQTACTVHRRRALNLGRIRFERRSLVNVSAASHPSDVPAPAVDRARVTVIRQSSRSGAPARAFELEESEYKPVRFPGGSGPEEVEVYGNWRAARAAGMARDAANRSWPRAIVTKTMSNLVT